MSEHLSEKQVELFRRRALSPAELLVASGHLMNCAECRNRVGGRERLKTEILNLHAGIRAAATEPNHLHYEQLAAYVDDGLNEIDREIVESHLEICAPCTTEAHELRAFAAGMAGDVPVVSRPASTPSMRERLAEFLRLPARWTPMQTAGVSALALFFVAVTVAYVFWRSSARTQPTVIAEAPRPATAESPVVPTVTPATTSTPSGSTTGDNSEQVASSETSRPQPSRTNTQTNAEPEAAPRTLLAISDAGNRVTMDERGNVAGLGQLPAAFERDVKQTLATQRVKTPAELSSLFGKDGALMSGTTTEGSFSVVAPVATVIRDTRPVLRWRELEGATSYTVSIYDADFREVLSSPPLNATEWKTPSALERGGVYTWQVVALKDGKLTSAPAPPAPEARFKVLEERKSSALERAISANPRSHLLRGILFAREGLLDEAEQEFLSLVKANPRSNAARRMLRNLRATRRR